MLCHDWSFSRSRPYLFAIRVHECNTLVLKHEASVFGHLSIRSPMSPRSVYLKIAAYPHPRRVSHVPHRSSPTTDPTGVESPTIMTIRGAMKDVTQDKPHYDCNTRNTFNRYHPIYHSFSQQSFGSSFVISRVSYNTYFQPPTLTVHLPTWTLRRAVPRCLHLKRGHHTGLN